MTDHHFVLLPDPTQSGCTNPQRVYDGLFLNARITSS